MDSPSFLTTGKMKALFAELTRTPKKFLGQNFLIDQNMVNKFIDASSFQKDDVVVEIGAGVGALTQRAAERCKELHAYEVDQRFIPILKKQAPRAIIHHSDILETKTEGFARGYALIGNLPYYITSRIVRHFLSASHTPSRCIFLVQKEIARRMCEKPGQMSLLSLSVQMYGVPKITALVSRNCFWPIPNVDSAMVLIQKKRTPVSTEIQKKVFSLARAGFSSKRKQLATNLSKRFLEHSKQEWQEKLAEVGLHRMIRAQELGVADWIAFARVCRVPYGFS